MTVETQRVTIHNPKTGAEQVKDTAAGAEKKLAQVPGGDAAKGALEQAVDASGAGAAAVAVGAQFSAEEHSVLKALSGSDPAAVDRSLALSFTSSEF